jgi:hypothetical protein
MGIMDIFHAAKIKKENERLLTELEDTKKLLTPEMMDACNLENHIRELQSKENAINESINKANSDLDEIKANNVRLVLQVLNCLGIKTIYRTKQSQFFSNIIEL